MTKTTMIIMTMIVTTTTTTTTSTTTTYSGGGLVDGADGGLVEGGDVVVGGPALGTRKTTGGVGPLLHGGLRRPYCQHEASGQHGSETVGMSVGCLLA